MTVVGIGVVSYVIVQNKSTNYKNITRNNADDDVARAVDRITAIMRSPAHCNANFRNKRFLSAYTPLTEISECSGGNCKGTGTVVTALNLNNFQMFAGGPISKAKISSLSYSLTTTQSTNSTGVRPRAGFPTSLPAVVTLTIQFEKNLGFSQSGAMKTVRTKPFTIDAYVVTSTFNHNTWTLTDQGAGLIIGCARSPASTVAYPTN